MKSFDAWRRDVEAKFMLLILKVRDLTGPTTTPTGTPLLPQLPVEQPLNTFYIAPSVGNDTNAGSITRPLATLDAAFKRMGIPLSQSGYEQHMRAVYLDGAPDKSGGVPGLLVPTFRSVTIERGAGEITPRLMFAPQNAQRFGSLQTPCLTIRGDAQVPSFLFDSSARIGGLDLRGDTLGVLRLEGVQLAGNVREAWTGGAGSFCLAVLDRCGHDPTLATFWEPTSGLVADCKVPLLATRSQFVNTSMIVDSIASNGADFTSVALQVRAAPGAQIALQMTATRWAGGSIVGPANSIRVDALTNWYMKAAAVPAVLATKDVRADVVP